MTETVIHLFREGLLLAAAVSLPPLAAAWLTQVVVSSLQQAATLPQARGLAHAPQLLSVGLTLVLTGPWIARQLVSFAQLVFESIAQIGGA